MAMQNVGIRGAPSSGQVGGGGGRGGGCTGQDVVAILARILVQGRACHTERSAVQGVI